MERFKENIQLRQKQNIVSTVLMICFLLLALAFWKAGEKTLFSDHTNRDISNMVSQSSE